MVTVQEASVSAINAALLRSSAAKSETTVNNVQNVTNVTKTTEVVKLADGTTLDIGALRQANTALNNALEALTVQLNKQNKQIQQLKEQVENIDFSTENSGKTLIFSNYMGAEAESEVPVVVAQYSTNGLAWHDTFVEGQDIYIRFSYNEGESWTDPIKIVGEDGSAYAYYGLVYNAASIPASSEGNFFLCGSNFSNPAELLVNGYQLLVNGYVLTTNRIFQKGYIYVYQDGSWNAVTDKNNYRYVIAMNDLITIGEELSPGLLEQFQSSIVTYTPKYLGGFAAAPLTANNGDTFCYTGETTSTYTKGMCYKWSDSSGWSLLDVSSNQQTYMSALSDILANTDEVGTFAAVFADSICSNSAFINSLAAKVITLQSGGCIQSDGFVSGSNGFKINYNGDVEFGNGIFRGILGYPEQLASGTDEIIYNFSDFSLVNDHDTIADIFNKELYKLILFSSNETETPSARQILADCKYIGDITITPNYSTSGSSSGQNYTWTLTISGTVENATIETITQTITWYYGKITYDVDPSKIGTYTWKRTNQYLDVTRIEVYNLTSAKITINQTGSLLAVKQSLGSI